MNGWQTRYHSILTFANWFITMVGLSNVNINSPSDYQEHSNGTQNLLLGMRHRSDKDEWNLMFLLFKEETDPSEKNKIMTGLAGIRSTEVLKELVLSPLSTIF